MKIPKLNKIPFSSKPLVSDGTIYVIDTKDSASFATRKDARDFKRAYAKALSKPNPDIVVHEFQGGFELPERKIT